MHSVMIFLALAVAIGIRLIFSLCSYGLSHWQRSLLAFMAPPLLLLMTAMAVIFMGYHGQMLGFQASRFSYLLAVFFLLFAVIRGLEITYQGCSSLQKIKSYPQKLLILKGFEFEEYFQP